MQTTVDCTQLVESIGDAVIASDPSGAITLWSPAATRMFGYTEAEALGKSLDIIIPQRQQLKAKYPHLAGYDVLRVPAMHKDGHTLSIAFTVAMLHTADGKISAIVAVVRDESARFAEDRNLRKRLTELEMQVAAHGKA